MCISRSETFSSIFDLQKHFSEIPATRNPGLTLAMKTVICECPYLSVSGGGFSWKGWSPCSRCQCIKALSLLGKLRSEFLGLSCFLCTLWLMKLSKKERLKASACHVICYILFLILQKCCTSNISSINTEIYCVQWLCLCSVVCKQNKINFLAWGWEDKLAHQVRKCACQLLFCFPVAWGPFLHCTVLKRQSLPQFK